MSYCQVPAKRPAAISRFSLRRRFRLPRRDYSAGGADLPSQMGRTWLMVRVPDWARRLSEGGDRPIYAVALSLQQADQQVLNDLDSFLHLFCALITRKLRLPHRVDEHWSPTFGSKGNCTASFSEFAASIGAGLSR